MLVAVGASACGFQISVGTEPVADATRVDSPDVDVDAEIDANMLCGNEAIDGDEECDDGNAATGDGCSTCQIEPAWMCKVGICARVTSLLFTPSDALASAGSSGGGNTFTHTCAAGSAIVGFEGDASNGQTDMGRMRAACARISFEDDGDAVWTTVQNTPYAAQQMAGNLGTKRCANDSVVVGYIANAGQYLSGLQLICMPITLVHGALAYGPPVTLTTFGPATRTDQLPTQCGAGEATNVFEGKAGSVFDHFDLKCAELSPVTQ